MYHLVPADLRHDPAQSLAPHLLSPPPSPPSPSPVLPTSTPENPEPEPILSPAHPTLLLFECVLAYMAPAASARLVQWFADLHAGGGGVLGAVVYEMFGLQDAFGQVMLGNLQVRPSCPPSPLFSTIV